MLFARKQHADQLINLDVNHDDFLDEDEFMRGTKSFNPPLTDKEARYALEGLDFNKDGKLDQLEYEGYYGINHHGERYKPTPGQPAPATG